MQTQYNDPKGAAGAVKVPLGLIPPHAMEQTAWVHKLGSEKYGIFNWRKTGVCASTYVNAILRHLNAWRDGEDLDPESGISHLAHIACSANILMDAEYCGKLQDDRNTTRQCNEVEEADDDWDWDWLFNEEEEKEEEKEEEENPFAKRIKDFLHSLNGDECRVLDRGEILQDGDEIYVGFGDWLPLYIPHWVEQKINGGTYRRKITDCDLKEKQSCPECDALASYVFNDGPCDYHKNKTCDSKPEPQLKVADCDLKEECKCGRRYVYHWLYGWICEDCDLKLSDYYP